MKGVFKKLTSAQIITDGFALAIIVGTLLLLLPFATTSGKCAGFLTALFTSTSALCVTGLVVQNTATFWSPFGQVVILLLIQIGGLGVVSMATLFMLLARKRIGLLERSTLQETISAPKLSGVVKLTGFVIIITLAFEFLGFLMLLPVFCKDFGPIGIWYSLFHSISAFCNAGFDIISPNYSSLTAYSANPLLNITIVLLIVIGGIGFSTLNDFRVHKLRFGRFSLQSKVVLLTSFLLILIPMLYFFLFEYRNMPIDERILASLFQSVTTRTAGFNTMDLTKLSDTGVALMIFLMLVGGSPGSTAGGMKTTTLVILILASTSVFRRKRDITCFKRRIPEKTVRNAVAILILYLALFFVGGAVISGVEGIPLMTCLFETASAVGTVGLTLGITPSLGVASKLILIILMYLGRVGAMTMVFVTVTSKKDNGGHFPEEKITIG